MPPPPPGPTNDPVPPGGPVGGGGGGGGGYPPVPNPDPNFIPAVPPARPKMDGPKKFTGITSEF